MDIADDLSPLNQYVIVKWVPNTKSKRGSLVSKTLGKYCYVDKKFTGTQPQAGTMWVVKIVHESNPGLDRGSFAVVPIMEVPKVDGDYDLIRLLPGAYNHASHNGISWFFTGTFHEPLWWILPLRLRQNIQGSYAYLVPLDPSHFEEKLQGE